MIRLDQFPDIEMPKHGGRLKEAIANSGFGADHWLDLSTGINPNAWPVPNIPGDTFQRLPEADNSLENAAYNYYLNETHLENKPSLLAIPGSQWFIQHFPQIVKSLSNKTTLDVLLPLYGFSEHAFWWHRHQHNIHHYHDIELQSLLSGVIDADVMVIINPNNPTTHFTPTSEILKAARYNPNTLFIVDEAFMDTKAEQSLLNAPFPINLIVLRSLGKFFGLAGLRVGFVFAEVNIIFWLKSTLGPWPIATPSRWIATQALEDKEWHAQSTALLKTSIQQLAGMLDGALANHDISYLSSDYFITLDGESPAFANKLYERFKQQAVLTRLIENSSLLRIGLPENTKMGVFEDRLKAVFNNI